MGEIKPFMTRAEGELFRKITLEGRAEKGLDTDLERLVAFYEERIPTYGKHLRLALFGPWTDEGGEGPGEQDPDSHGNNV